MMINETLKGLDFYFAYLDDSIISSQSEKENLDHLWQIFNHLCKANIKLKLAWHDFFKTQIHNLGHLVSREVCDFYEKN